MCSVFRDIMKSYQWERRKRKEKREEKKKGKRKKRGKTRAQAITLLWIISRKNVVLLAPDTQVSRALFWFAIRARDRGFTIELTAAAGKWIAPTLGTKLLQGFPRKCSASRDTHQWSIRFLSSDFLALDNHRNNGQRTRICPFARSSFP